MRALPDPTSATLPAVRCLALVVVLVAGCQPDLGPCDPEAAREVVFVDARQDDVTGVGGQAMFAGQALLVSSCGNGAFCHAEVSAPSLRFGAFAGWSLDLRPACDARAPADRCSAEDRARLQRAQRDAWRARHELFGQVERGSMPPRRAWDAIRRENPVPTFARADGTPLPGLDTAEGRLILANWLACNAPVVEEVRDLRPGRMAGDFCGDLALGDCIDAGPRSIEPPDPSWPSIYARVIRPLCANCHGPGPTDYRIESQLDLSDADTAYRAIVGVQATGAFCLPEGRAQVVPGDPMASVFYEKMATDQTCGDRMPQGGPYLPASVLEAIALWIENGARRE